MSLLDRILRREYRHTTHVSVYDKPDFVAQPNGWDHSTTLRPSRISFEFTHEGKFRRAFIWGFITERTDFPTETVATFDHLEDCPDWVREDYFEN